MKPWKILAIIISSLSTIYFPVETTQEGKTIKWVPAAEFDKTNQEWAGSIGTSPLFIARVDQGNGRLVGKYDLVNKISVFINKTPTNFGTDGYVLTYPYGTVSWTGRSYEDVNTRAPPNLIIGGIDPQDSEPIYICRAMLGNPSESKIVPGTFKFSREQKGCQVDYDGIPAYVDTNYELLSMNLLAIAMDAAG